MKQPISCETCVWFKPGPVPPPAESAGECRHNSPLVTGGMILVNTDKSVADLGLSGDFQVFAFSATDLAREILGRPIMNTALLGAFAAVTKELGLDAVLKAVRSRFPGDLGEKNARVVEESYKRLMGDKK